MLPSVDRQCAVFYSDGWEAYASVLPSKRHRVVGKESGLTFLSGLYKSGLPNTLLSTLDEMAGRLSLLEEELSSYSEKMLMSVATRYGKDSLE